MNATESKSILVIVLGLSILSFLLDNRFDWAHYLLYAGLGIGVLSMLFEKIGVLIVKGWMKIGHALGYVNSRILLSIVFFVFLLPMALLYRAFSKNPLQLKEEGDTTFVDRNHTYTAKDLENIW